MVLFWRSANISIIFCVLLSLFLVTIILLLLLLLLELVFCFILNLSVCVWKDGGCMYHIVR